MNKKATIDSKETKKLIEACFEQNLRMENSIFRTMIDMLLRQCPDMSFQGCYNAAIVQMVKNNK